MIETDRKKLLSIYGGRYKAILTASAADRNLCLYCGEPSDCKDHQPPISKIENISHLHGQVEYALIPSCNECNSLLSDSMTATIQDRFTLCKELLSKKYSKQLNATVTERDTYGLKGRLKKQCEAYDKAAKIIRKRISFNGYPYESGGVHAVTDNYLFKYDDRSFSCKSEAMAYACSMEGINYDALCKKIDTSIIPIDDAILEYKNMIWVKRLTKHIDPIRRDRWPSIAKKAIVSELKRSCSDIYTLDDSIRFIDDMYNKYILRTKNM